MIASRRRAPLRRRLGARRPGPRVLGAVLLVVVLLGGIYLWLRDSSLVAVQRVRITGVSGPDAGRIRAALRTAARNMTTLDVQMGQLQTAVRPYPVVKRLRVETSFPHAMTIRVDEQNAVAVIAAAGRRTAVAGDGTLLPGSVSTSALPTIALTVPPGGTRLTGDALAEVRLAAAAPYRLLARVSDIGATSIHGLTAKLRDGPAIYFGGPGQLRQKWSAALSTLADPKSAGAAYIDVSVPDRPAAGAGADANAPLSGTSATTPAGAGATPTGAGTAAAPTTTGAAAGTVSTSG
ncbi:MAG TPA: hypothetical protein VFN55_18110 [Solirubrobacteraceae bacterium]|nr:hypothetical protein [Solirubrobacteraceae bacterium]